MCERAKFHEVSLLWLLGLAFPGWNGYIAVDMLLFVVISPRTADFFPVAIQEPPTALL